MLAGTPIVISTEAKRSGEISRPNGQESGCGFAAGCVEGLWRKVLKMDRPLAGGFSGLTGPLGPRVVLSPLRGDEYICPPAAGEP